MARRVLTQQAKKSHIKILDYVNVGNHLHLTIRLQSRDSFRQFSRAATGLIARQALHRERGPAKPAVATAYRKTPFWDHRPFTCIVTWARDLKQLMRYLEKNHGQASFAMEELYRSGDEDFSSA